MSRTIVASVAGTSDDVPRQGCGLRDMGALEQRVRVLRSKNAGPFVITLDVAFRERDDFIRAKREVNSERVSRWYKIPHSHVLSIGYVDALLAIKVSYVRPIPAGHPGDPDCYGMNQEEPLRRLLEEIFVG